MDENPNVAVVRQMWAAYGELGLEGILQFAAPDAEWRPYSADGRVFSSTGEYREYIDQMAEQRQVVESTLTDLYAERDCVVVSGRLRTRGPDGIRDNPMHWVHRFESGKIVWTASFTDLDTALRTAGLRSRNRLPA